MKNKILILFVSIKILTSVICAQPILTSSQINPIIGDTYSFKYGGPVSPGGAGINQIWDLSTITTGTFTQVFNMITPPTTPTNSPYAQSNIVMQYGGGRYYYTFSNLALIYVGSYLGVDSWCSDTEISLAYPFNYQDSIIDSWYINYANGLNYYSTGTTYTKYDGYGTLILPGGVTYNNVVRIHYRRIYNEYNIPTYPTTIDEKNNYRDGYKWYLNGNHQPLVETYTISSIANYHDNSSVSDTTKNLILLTNIVSSVEEHSSISSVTSFPNPAINEISFKLNNNLSVTSLDVFDMSGKKIYNETYENTSVTDVIKINTSDFKDGIYFVKFTAQDGQIGTKKINIVK